MNSNNNSNSNSNSKVLKGCLMGQYQQLPGSYKGSPYYKQLNSYELSYGFLYRAQDGCWSIANHLGRERKLKNKVRHRT